MKSGHFVLRTEIEEYTNNEGFSLSGEYFSGNGAFLPTDFYMVFGPLDHLWTGGNYAGYGNYTSMGRF